MNSNISRRHLAKGAAWTVPAVTIAASAPSLAASQSSGEDGPTPPVVVQGASFAEKCQGQAQVPGGWPKQGYRMVLTVSSVDAPAPTVASVVLGNGSAATVVAGPVSIGAGEWEYVVKASASPSTLTVTYTITDGTVRTVTIPASPHCGG